MEADTFEPTGSVSVLRGVNREMLRWEMGGADRDKWIEENSRGMDDVFEGQNTAE